MTHEFPTTAKNGSQLLLEALRHHNVDTVFGITGGAIMPVFDEFPNYPEISLIMSRHEQGSAFEAGGYARVTGRPGICMTTSGPGATNLITGIADAMMDSTPIIAITGQVSTSVIGTDAFQESDVVGMMIPITKQAYLVEDAHDIPMIVAEAFAISLGGRPGPVHIDLPKDIATQVIDKDKIRFTPRYQIKKLGAPSKQTIDKAIEFIDDAERPVAFIGHGVRISRTHKEAQAFIEKSNIPFSWTLHGTSAIPSDHPLSLGMMGMHGTVEANRAIEKTDLIIAFGMRFDDRVTGKLSEYAKNAKVIHVEIDPSEIDKNVPTDLAIHADLKETFKELTKAVRYRDYASWYEDINANREYWKSRDLLVTQNGIGKNGKPLMSYVISTLSKMTEGMDKVVSDVGQHEMFPPRYYTFKTFNSLFSSGGSGTMGFSLPTAIGVKHADPSRRVWAVMGDGSFQMNVQELGTIMQYGMDVKIIILNNLYLGMVKQWQDLFFDKRYVATPLVNPNFVEIANAYGISGEVAKSQQEIQTAIQNAMNHQGSYMIEIQTDPDELILPMIPAGATMGEMMIEVK